MQSNKECNCHDPEAIAFENNSSLCSLTHSNAFMHRNTETFSKECTYGEGETKGALAPEVSPKADVHCFENVGVLLCIYAEECVSEHTLFYLNYFLKSIFNLMQAKPVILIIFTNSMVCDRVNWKRF